MWYMDVEEGVTRPTPNYPTTHAVTAIKWYSLLRCIPRRRWRCGRWRQDFEEGACAVECMIGPLNGHIELVAGGSSGLGEIMKGNIHHLSMCHYNIPPYFSTPPPFYGSCYCFHGALPLLLHSLVFYHGRDHPPTTTHHSPRSMCRGKWHFARCPRWRRRSGSSLDCRTRPRQPS